MQKYRVSSLVKTDAAVGFFSGDDRYPCCIESKRDCSQLHGYISPGNDARPIKNHFLQLLRIATECYLARRDGVSLHASCIFLNGKSLLFTAPAGTGKSTQARIWEEALGAEILSGDRPFLHLFPGEVRAYGVPWDGKEQIFRQKDKPVAAIIEVRRANHNHIRKMSENQACRLLMKQCFLPMWDNEATMSAIRTIRGIARTVPCYRFFLPADSRCCRAGAQCVV